jgi:hypothetical protein
MMPNPAAEPTASPQARIVTLAPGEPLVIADESLTLTLVDVKDRRCPQEVQCIWAGHAAVTLQVGKAGWDAELVTIGTYAPAGMKLPFDAQYGHYQLHLVGLKPGKSALAPVALPQYRATITVTTERR